MTDWKMLAEFKEGVGETNCPLSFPVDMHLMLEQQVRDAFPINRVPEPIVERLGHAGEKCREAGVALSVVAKAVQKAYDAAGLTSSGIDKGECTHPHAEWDGFAESKWCPECDRTDVPLTDVEDVQRRSAHRAAHR